MEPSPLIHNLIFVGIVIIGLLCLLLLTPDYSKKDENDKQSPFLHEKNNPGEMPASYDSAGFRAQINSDGVNEDVC